MSVVKEKIKRFFTKENIRRLEKKAYKIGARAEKVQEDMFGMPQVKGVDFFGTPKKKRKRRK